MKKLAQDFNTAAQDSNLDPLSRESEALPLSHCGIMLSLTMHVHPSVSPVDVGGTVIVVADWVSKAAVMFHQVNDHLWILVDL